MATEINLPTKANQDLIKEKTDLIGSSNPSVGGTDTLFKMLKSVLDKPTPSGGTDWSKYSPFITTTYPIPPSATWQEVYRLTGKGYLKKAIIRPGSAMKGRIAVSVDGVVIYQGNTNYSTAGQLIGITPIEDINLNSNFAPYTSHDSGFSYLIGSNGIIGSRSEQLNSAILYQPIFFKSSVVISVMGDGGNQVALTVIGGLEN